MPVLVEFDAIPAAGDIQPAYPSTTFLHNGLITPVRRRAVVPRTWRSGKPPQHEHLSPKASLRRPGTCRVQRADEPAGDALLERSVDLAVSVSSQVIATDDRAWLG